MKKRKERKKSTFWKDFKAFISRGNVVDMAVAVVVGAAFTAIVNSLVNDIIKPLIAVLVNGDFSELVIVLREASYAEDGVTVLTEAITLNYGNLIMAILTFLIDAFVIFTVLRIVTKVKARLQESGEKLKDMLMKDEKEEAEAATEAAAEAETEVQPEAQPEVQPEICAQPVEVKPTVEELLAEIRDLLKSEKSEEAEKSEQDK